MKNFKLLTVALCIGTSLVANNNYLAHCALQIYCFGSYQVVPGQIPYSIVREYEIMQQFCNNPNILDNVNDWNSLRDLVEEFWSALDDFNERYKTNFHPFDIHRITNVFDSIRLQLFSKAQELRNIVQNNNQPLNQQLQTEVFQTLNNCFEICSRVLIGI